MAKLCIETERLILRELVPEDSERMFLLDSSHEVMKYLGMKPLTKIEETAEIIQKIRQQYMDNGIGRWAVVDKTTDLLIGWSGLKILKEKTNGYQNVYELGYRFLPDFWGRGYATEAAAACLNYGFENLNLEVIYAYATTDNHASNNVLRKLGFTETETFVDPSDDAECFWFALKREDFKA
ncbi:GNAT family N-acetyltransferase [Chryseobacterium sp. R2A-55]|uniref:GNAT family N-acetyltransferase n=1 Tax=Chryseobacterium sp. R2A-55 TaxID=2744445 RepID=UPI001F4708F1|nr:GNAT family N-acetyltransferase [Chryseobacterium sp. R2A-55]